MLTSLATVEKSRRMESDKARTAGISFSPGSLYEEAAKYGRSLTPKQNASEVVCNFLREGLVEVGWLKLKSTPRVTAAEARAIAIMRAKGAPVLEILEAAAESENLGCPVLPHIQAALADISIPPVSSAVSGAH